SIIDEPRRDSSHINPATSHLGRIYITSFIYHQIKNHYFCTSNFIVEKTNFVDQIRIFCRSGHGGAGSKHFARTKFNPLAGPDGGNGGRGGHIILKGNRNLWTLLH